jgi:hypothetical protein
MVHFPGFARARLWIHRAVRRFYPRGFPHSEIPGSMPACGSPRLIAACHVLHRLLLPRHPPCALSSLTTKFTRHTGRLHLPLSAIAFSNWLKPTNTPRKLYGPRSPAHRAPSVLTLPRPSRVLQALIKIYSLVDCPIYSVVKYRPGWFSPVVPPWRVSDRFQPNVRHQAAAFRRMTPNIGLGVLRAGSSCLY